MLEPKSVTVLRFAEAMPRRFPLLLLVAALAATFLLCAAAGAAEPEHTLRYDKPASTWTEALPIGNGRIGAMVFGGTSEERVQINESTLWGGRPHEYTIRRPVHTSRNSGS